MSQLGGGGSQQVGGVHFVVGAVGAEQAKAQVDAAAASVQNLGNTAQAAAPKTQAANNVFSAFGSTVKGATAPIRGAISAVVGVIGAFTRMIGIVGLVTTGIGLLVAGFRTLTRDADETARAFVGLVSKMQGAARELGATMVGGKDQFDKYREAIDDWAEASANWRDEQKLNRAELAMFNKGLYDTYMNLVSLNDMLRARDTDRKAEEEHEKRMAALRKEIHEETMRQVDEAQAARKKAADATQRFIELEYHTKNEQRMERKRAEQEELEHLKRLQAETAAFFDDFRSQQSALFNGNGTSFALAEMVQLLTQIANKPGGRF